MSASKLRRFYSEVAVVPVENGFNVQLDGKPLRTPEQNSLVLPTLSLGEGLADEWRRAVEHVDPQTMPYTKLAFTAVDRVSPHREAVVEQISAYANADVVCYRASEPGDLKKRQQDDWDSILEWAQSKFNVAIRTGEGISHFSQEHDTLCALTSAFSDRSSFYLAALHTLVANSSSLILSLAVAAGNKGADEAFRAANCDELYQWDKWGRDAEAEACFLKRAAEFRAGAEFIKLLGERTE